jgi:hypothetical protein
VLRAVTISLFVVAFVISSVMLSGSGAAVVHHAR